MSVQQFRDAHGAFDSMPGTVRNGVAFLASLLHRQAGRQRGVAGSSSRHSWIPAEQTGAATMGRVAFVGAGHRGDLSPEPAAVDRRADGSHRRRSSASQRSRDVARQRGWQRPPGRFFRGAETGRSGSCAGGRAGNRLPRGPAGHGGFHRNHAGEISFLRLRPVARVEGTAPASGRHAIAGGSGLVERAHRSRAGAVSLGAEARRPGSRGLDIAAPRYWDPSAGQWLSARTCHYRELRELRGRRGERCSTRKPGTSTATRPAMRRK